MGETTVGGLYEFFLQDYGPAGSPSFEAAHDSFIISSAGYAVASLLLQPKDRHNGNLLFDNVGRLVHIDLGFILETSPGENMRFEGAHFKLTQLLDPSGVMKSDTWIRFVRLWGCSYCAISGGATWCLILANAAKWPSSASRHCCKWRHDNSDCQ